MIGEEFSLPEDAEFLWLILGLIWINRTWINYVLGSLGDEILASYIGMINDYKGSQKNQPVRWFQ